MNIFLDYTNDKPMYEQIEIGIKELIINGDLKENEKLPSVRALASELNVSTITVKRAYLDLEKEEVTYSVNGVGTFIKLKDSNILINEKIKGLFNELDQIVLNIKKSGVNEEEIINRVEKMVRG